MSNTWSSDLEYGRKWENYVLNNYIGDWEKHETAPDEYFPDWDFRVCRDNDNWEAYEVKADRLAYKTGNLFIEVGQKKYGREYPSGLSTSKADYYIYLIMNEDGQSVKEYFDLETEWIRDAIQTNNWRRITTSDGVVGVLIPSRELF